MYFTFVSMQLESSNSEDEWSKLLFAMCRVLGLPLACASSRLITGYSYYVLVCVEFLQTKQAPQSSVAKHAVKNQVTCMTCPYQPLFTLAVT